MKTNLSTTKLYLMCKRPLAGKAKRLRKRKELTKKEIRASKLRVLRYKKIKTGILKNKEV